MKTKNQILRQMTNQALRENEVAEQKRTEEYVDVEVKKGLAELERVEDVARRGGSYCDIYTMEAKSHWWHRSKPADDNTYQWIALNRLVNHANSLGYNASIHSDRWGNGYTDWHVRISW